MQVKAMLALALLSWAILAVISHGLSVLVYLGIQLVTTGLFAFCFSIVENSYERG
jgi:Na+/glutamate symporter